MSKIVFIGTGAATDPDLPNTSILYSGRTKLLLECGYDVPHAFWKHTRDPGMLDGIWISHHHADHTFGLPGLMLWMRLRGRRRPLKILGAEGTREWLHALLEMAYPGAFSKDKSFPIEVVELRPGETVEMGELTLKVAKTNHSIRNLALRVEVGEHRFCYSGDGALSEASLELYRGTDLVIHECFSARQAPSGHASAEELLKMADSLELQSLYLVHMAHKERRAIHAMAMGYRGTTELMLPVPEDMVRLDR